MHTLIRRLLRVCLFVTVAIPCQLLAEPGRWDTEIFEKLRTLNTLREALASSLDNRTAPIDETTFKQTCMPIGKELMRWAQEHGYQARQISHKNRNPQNAISAQDREVYALFLKDRERLDHKVTHSLESSGPSYYGRIPYVYSCRHCHGSKASRPNFVTSKYPEDAAYDFQDGDLRGVYVIRERVDSPKADGPGRRRSKE